MAATEATTTGRGDYAGVRALVVEDNDFVRDLVASQLKQIGFTRVETAPHGEAALKIVDEETPGLMICDINMEPMGGFELIHRLRDKGMTGSSGSRPSCSPATRCPSSSTAPACSRSTPSWSSR